MDDNKQVKKWVYLGIGVIIILLFVYVVAPIIEHSSDTFEEISEVIDEKNINTDAYIYTDSELSGEASVGARSTIEHPPEKPREKE